MVSSAQDELRDLRALLGRTLETAGYQPLLFESGGASSESAPAFAADYVRQCDVYVGVVGATFSQPTVDEYHLAEDLLKPILVYLDNRPNPLRDARIDAFVSEVRKHHKYDEFRDAVDLSEKMIDAISRSLAKGLSERGARANAVARDIEDEVSRLFAGTLLFRSHGAGRLPFSVRGATLMDERALVVLDKGSGPRLQEGLLLDLHRVQGDSSEVVGVLKSSQASTSPELILCDFAPATTQETWWREFSGFLTAATLTPFEGETYVSLSSIEQYRTPELGIHSSVSKVRKELGT
jgi:hypothetical protein